MQSPTPNTDHGKKVFFVKPNSVIQKEMVSELIRREFEVYLVPDVTQAKKLFALHPDCIAFLNIDEGLSEEDWEALVVEIQSNPELSSVRLGILTYNADPHLAEKYLLHHSLPCGFIKLSLHLAESTAIVIKALDANEARGRRNALRVICGENTRLNFLSLTGMVEGRVKDISIIGMACSLSPDKDWKRHSVLSSIQLQLKGSLCLVDGIVMGSRIAPDTHERVYVVVFDPKTPATQKEKIRSYMQWALQDQLDRELRVR